MNVSLSHKLILQRLSNMFTQKKNLDISGVIGVPKFWEGNTRGQTRVSDALKYLRGENAVVMSSEHSTSFKCLQFYLQGHAATKSNSEANLAAEEMSLALG